MIKVPRLIFGDFILNLGFRKFTAQKIKFSITDLFSKCDQIRSNGKLHFLCSINFHHDSHDDELLAQV